MIEFNNVSKSFDSKIVLSQIDLKLEAFQTHVILGSSGCGKSTLLKLMMGLISADRGKIQIDGLEILPHSNSPADRETKRKIRSKIGYVLQHAGLFPHLTAYENITLVARLSGDSKWTDPEFQKSRTSELAKLVDLDEGLLQKYPQKLSGGQRQRVGLMRALMLNPEILLFDEPLGALDPVIRAQLQEDLLKIFRSLKKTVIMVTHDISEAAYLGNTVTLLHEGRVIQHGKMEELVRAPKDPVVTSFLGAQRQPEILREIQ